MRVCSGDVRVSGATYAVMMRERPILACEAARGGVRPGPLELSLALAESLALANSTGCPECEFSAYSADKMFGRQAAGCVSAI